MLLINTAAKNTSPTALTPLYSYLPSSPVFLPVLPPAELVRWSPHVTWYLSAPSPHTKNQPTNVRLLLHTGKHIHNSRLHMAVFHSHLVDFSACCCFCVYVLCSQLPWEQKSPQDKVVYTSNSLYKCMTSSTTRSWYRRTQLWNETGTYKCRKALSHGMCKLLNWSPIYFLALWWWPCKTLSLHL